MHAVLTDGESRIVDSLTDVPLIAIDDWLDSRSDAVRCDVYEDDNKVRGKLVAVYCRDQQSGRWTPR